MRSHPGLDGAAGGGCSVTIESTGTSPCVAVLSRPGVA